MKKNSGVYGMPSDAKRITNAAGERVWVWQGKEYPTQRAVIRQYNMLKNSKK